jgi:hypothetical protein
MMELFYKEPWLVVIVLGCMIPILGIVFGTVTNYLQKTRQAELDASLKHEMLQRGMSAEEIVMVIEARPGKSKRKECESGTGGNAAATGV